MKFVLNIKDLLVIIIMVITVRGFGQNWESIGYSENKIFQSSNLPLILINTNSQPIEHQQRIAAEMGIINNGKGNRNFLNDNFNDFDGRIAIELRGSSSAGYPKPQFRFETQDSLGENLNVSLCGLPAENDWILNGPYNDKSLIRNVLSYNLSLKFGRYASRTVYCEVFVNEEYLGLYILMEKIKRDNDRIDISKLTESDNTGDELTGGYIVKIDKLDGENVDLWFSNYNTPYQYHYPKPDDITQQQKEYIRNYMNEFEDLMNSDDFNNPLNGYQNFIDVDSFVDHFILNEFCKNVDAYRLSAYLYKDKNSINPKLIAGPIWDFNLTFGDAWNEEDINIATDWQVDYTILNPEDIFRVPFWWKKLSNDHEFVLKLKNRWFDLRESDLSIDTLFKQIYNITEYIKEARVRNFERWPEALLYEYHHEIARLKGWILNRVEWIDENLDELSDVNSLNQSNILNEI
ncbi:MAG: CotH kinase family protein, partial [Melioribacteraceae bacterium]|nr:CotH kinase family protein [Melioribacteraceae bacterium]